MTPILSRIAPWTLVFGLAACSSGVQHVPPAADATNVATVEGGSTDRNMTVVKLQFNAKRCYQGETDMTSNPEPLRVEAGTPTFFSARYRRGDTTCMVVLSFTPEVGHRYAVSADYHARILAAGSCSAVVRELAADGKWQPVPAERWTLRPAGPVCMRPARAS